MLRLALRTACLKRKRFIAVGSIALALVVLVSGAATLRRLSAHNVLTPNPAGHSS